MHLYSSKEKIQTLQGSALITAVPSKVAVDFSGANPNFTAMYQASFYMICYVVQKKTIFVCFTF